MHRAALVIIMGARLNHKYAAESLDPFLGVLLAHVHVLTIY